MHQENLSSYDTIDEEIKFIVRSEIKLKILLSLCESDLDFKQLNELGINYGSISSNIKQLENNGIITKLNDRYHIKNSAKKKIINLVYLNQIIKNINSFDDYFNSHHIKNNNLSILEELPLSIDYEIIHNTPLNPYKVVNTFTKNMNSEGEVKVIFTHIHPEFLKINKTDAKTPTELKIIVPKNIKEYLIDNKHKEKKCPLTKRIIKVKSIEDIKLSLVISKNEAMIVLYNNDGSYDTNTGIISRNPDIILWGSKLFDEIESLSDDDYLTLNNI